MSESEDREPNWYREAVRHEDNGDFAQALVCIERHLEFDPDGIRGQVFYANLLSDLRRFEDAESILLELDLATTNKAYWAVCWSWAHLYRTKDDCANAVVWARRLIESRPDWTVGYIYLGSSLARLGRFEDAVAAYLPATELPADSDNDPDEAYLNIGLIRRAQRRFGEAVDALDKAIEIDSDYQLYQDVRNDLLAAAKLQDEINRN